MAAEQDPAQRPTISQAGDSPPVTVGEQRLGKYQLQGLLGEGGMGEVHRALDSQLGRVVALKILRQSRFAEAQTEQDELVQRFLREGQATAALDHANIVRVYDVGSEAGVYYIAMQLIEGQTLADFLDQALPKPRRSAEIMRAVSLAMAHAHAAGILHRDLKPHNVMLDGEGVPYLTDFGLARRIDDSKLTVSGQLLGTPAYMSPEQARGLGDQVNETSDVYGLGAILYELLCGVPPADGDDLQAVLYIVMHDDPPPPRRRNSEIDMDLETICLKCLEKNPASRYASAAELAADLERYLAGEPVTARRIGRLRRGARYLRRRPAVALLLGLLLAGLAGLAGWGVRSALALRTRERRIASAWSLLEAGKAEPAMIAFAALTPDETTRRGCRQSAAALLSAAGGAMRAGQLVRADRMRRQLASTVARLELKLPALDGFSEELIRRQALIDAVPRRLRIAREALDRILDKPADRMIQEGEIEDQIYTLGELLDKLPVGTPPDDLRQVRALLLRAYEARVMLALLTRDLVAARFYARRGRSRLDDPQALSLACKLTFQLSALPATRSLGATATFFRMPGAWLGSMEPAYQAQLKTARPVPLDKPVVLAAGRYLIRISAPGYLPVRFPLMAEPRINLIARLALYRNHPLLAGMQQVPMVRLSFEDLLGQPPVGFRLHDERRTRLQLLTHASQGQHGRFMKSYFASRDEITRAQWAAFVASLSSKNQRLMPLPLGWSSVAQDAQGERGKLPVEGVSMNEALDYAAWVSRQLEQVPWLRGLQATLPEAKYWTKLRHGPGYNIGDKDWVRFPQLTWDSVPSLRPMLGNIPAAGKRRALPAGSFPFDVGIYGHRDLYGNLHEWQLSKGFEKEVMLLGGSYDDKLPRRQFPQDKVPAVGFRLFFCSRGSRAGGTARGTWSRVQQLQSPALQRKAAFELYRQSRPDYLTALLLFDAAWEKSGKLKDLANTALLCQLLGNYPEALRRGALLLKKSEAAGRPELTGYGHFIRAWSCFMTQQWKTGLPHARKMLAQRKQSWGRQAVVGMFLVALEQTHEALPYVQSFMRAFRFQLALEQDLGQNLRHQMRSRGKNFILTSFYGRLAASLAIRPIADVILPDMAYIRMCYPKGRFQGQRSSDVFKRALKGFTTPKGLAGLAQAMGQNMRSGMAQLLELMACWQAFVELEQAARGMAGMAGIYHKGSDHLINGEVSYILSKFDQGIASFRKAARILKSVRATEGIGRGHLLRAIHARKSDPEDLRQAADAMGRALARSPRLYSALIYLSSTRIRQNQLKKAREALDRAARLPANKAPIWLYRGRLAQLEGDPDKARQAWDKAVELEPGFIPLVAQLRRTLASK